MSTVVAAKGGAMQVFALLWELMKASKDNQFVQLGVISALGGVVYKGQQLLRMLWRRFQQLFHVQVRLQNREKEVYDAVITFISTQKMVRSSMLLAEKKKVRKSWRERRNAWASGETDKPELELKPDNAQALYTFIYKGRRIAMWRKRGETITTGYDRKPLDQEELTLSCWGRDHSVLNALLQTAIDDEYKKNRSTDLTIWVRAAQSWMGGWEKAVTKKRRGLGTVVLDAALKAEIVTDAKKFINEPEYYANLGIPYRRGYLLYGPPGNGKTSFCQALAGELNLDICILNLSDASLNDNSLAESLRDAPANAIILIEDIDAAFVGRDDVGAAEKKPAGRRSSGGISFSGLLNAIDGAASQEGRILIMTTNHKEKLDPALIRPGRADFHREICNATREQAVTMFQRFFAELDGSGAVDDAAERFGARFPESGDVSMAMVQGFLQAHRGPDGMAKALAQVSRLGQGGGDEAAGKQLLNEDLPTYEYLRRCGLGKYAAGFEHHGYIQSSQMLAADLELSTIQKWYPELMVDAEECRRMGQALAAAKMLTNQMRYVPVQLWLSIVYLYWSLPMFLHRQAAGHLPDQGPRVNALRDRSRRAAQASPRRGGGRRRAAGGEQQRLRRRLNGVGGSARLGGHRRRGGAGAHAVDRSPRCGSLIEREGSQAGGQPRFHAGGAELPPWTVLEVAVDSLPQAVRTPGLGRR